MRTLYCDYFVPKSQPIATGEYWGVLGIINHSGVEQLASLTILKFETGEEIKSFSVNLKPKQSVLLSNTSEPFMNIIGRTRLYIDCTEHVTATVGNGKGNSSAISWERMVNLPFPK